MGDGPGVGIQWSQSSSVCTGLHMDSEVRSSQAAIVYAFQV